MINAIFGRPGGGKSYEAVKYIILPSILKDKRKVVTNIPVQLDYIEKVHGDEAADLVTVVEGAFSEFGEVRPFAHPQDYLQYKDWRNEKGQGVLLKLTLRSVKLQKKKSQNFIHCIVIMALTYIW
jgi:zona occludens toxin